MSIETVSLQLGGLLELLSLRAKEDAALREALRGLGSALLAWGADPVKAETEAPALAPDPALQGAELADAIQQLRTNLGAARAPVLPPAPLSDESLLETCIKRFELRAEGCAWNLQRRRMLEETGTDFRLDIAPLDQQIVDRAREMPGGCWMWMCRPEAPVPRPEDMDLARCCYENAAHATRLVASMCQSHDAESGAYTRALGLMAESLSALRVILEGIGAASDEDQSNAFEWLRRETYQRSIYIQRHMRLEDPADPSRYHECAERMNEIEQDLESQRRSERERKSGLKKLEYHLKKSSEDGPGQCLQHWGKVDEVISHLLRSGMKASNTALRDRLIDYVDSIPEEAALGAETRSLLEEIDRYLSARDAPGQVDEVLPAWNAEVDALRPVLGGKAIVLIGGDERRRSSERLREAFQLSRIDWQASRAHQSHYLFEPAIRREDVAAVLLAIRWSSHSYTEVSHLCEQHGKPFVRLPGGYHPNRVARCIIEQAGSRLGVGMAGNRPG